MSLNDYTRLSNRDLKLYKQLSDYRSVNGKDNYQEIFWVIIEVLTKKTIIKKF